MMKKIRELYKVQGMKNICIPIVICDILLPVIIFIMDKKFEDKELLIGNINLLLQMITPFCSTIWIFGLLSTYVDEHGKEIFYILKRNRVKDVLLLFVSFCLINLIPYAWYCEIDKQYMLRYVQMVIIYFFMSAAAYMCTYLFGEVALAIIPCLCYCFASILIDFGKYSFFSFYEAGQITINLLLTKYICYGIVAILFYAVGIYMNRRYTEY